MRTEELTDWMRESTVSSAPDLARITTMGRRRRMRGRLAVAGAGACVLAAVTTPFVVVSQMDQQSGADYAAAPSAPAYRPAEPLGKVWSDLNKLYLPGETSSVGPMSVWAEASPGGAPALHYGWKATDGVVHEVGTLVKANVLADGLQVHVVPSHGADATEPTFVVTYPIAPGTSVDSYNLGFESHTADFDAPRRVDVIPGFVVTILSPVQPGGGTPDVHFVGLTGPSGVMHGLDLNYDGGTWITSPADVATH